jgi:hypothetical protein
MKRPDAMDQLGQAFLWFLATLAACCALLMIVYNVGQVATEKEKTTNAADAVAMSGALVQARGLNLLAYNNRAIIANEMTIAQAASLDSWFEYNKQLTQNLATVTSWIPYVDAITQSVADAMTEIAPYVTQFAQYTTDAFQAAVDVLEIQRKYVIFPSIPVAAREMAGQVAKQNKVDMNDNLGFTTAAFLKNWNDYWNSFGNNNFFVDHTNSSGPNGSDDRGAAAAVIMNSRDQFTADRGAGTLIDNANAVASASPLRPELVKTSRQTKLRDFDHWEAQDSLDLFLDVCVPFTSICWRTPTLPVGWGRANVNDDGSQGENWANKGECVGGSSWTVACWLAGWWSPDQISGWKGVPDMLDVKDRTKAEISYYVSVKKAASTIATSQQMGIDNRNLPGPQGSPQVTDNLATVGGTAELQAISSARIFFKRPKRDAADKTEGYLARQDNVQEYASLYNPYWQARLHTPNCRPLGDPTSQDCVWREWLSVGMGSPGLEAAVDAVAP